MPIEVALQTRQEFNPIAASIPIVARGPGGWRVSGVNFCSDLRPGHHSSPNPPAGAKEWAMKLCSEFELTSSLPR